MDGYIAVPQFPQLVVRPYALGNKTGGTYSVLYVPLLWCAWWCGTGKVPAGVAEGDMHQALEWWSHRFSGWRSWCHRVSALMDDAPYACSAKTIHLYPGAQVQVPYITAATQEKLVRGVDAEIAASVSASQPQTNAKRVRTGEKKASPKKTKPICNRRFMF